jgi:hypothetical protein
MCAACVAQGSVYLGGAVVSLRVMAAKGAHARSRAGRRRDDDTAEPREDEPDPNGPVESVV